MRRQAGRAPKLTSLSRASVSVMVWRTGRSDCCVCQLRFRFSHSHFNVSGPSVSLSLIIACDHCLCRYQTRCQGTLRYHRMNSCGQRHSATAISLIFPFTNSSAGNQQRRYRERRYGPALCKPSDSTIAAPIVVTVARASVSHHKAAHLKLRDHKENGMVRAS